MSPQEEEKLSETDVQDSFHSYLKSSLTQAKIEHLLEPEILASAEADLMITGPALCLYFAALRSTTIPPSVPLPRGSKSAPPRQFSEANCPPAFLSFFRVWASNVHRIQGLDPSFQHDLARIICGLDPLIKPTEPSLSGIAADLRAVAIEISQRRTFQDRYASDLQAALDAGGGSSSLKVKTSFVPPPVYDGPGSSSPSKKSAISRSHSPTLFSPESPAIEFIRETLYAALADVLERMPSLRRLLKRDPPRAYFASTAFAILDVASTAVTPDGTIVGILGRELTLQECPHELKPLMAELVSIGHSARQMTEEDDLFAAQCLQGGEELPESRLERVKKMLEGGVGYDQAQGDDESDRRSIEGRAVVFTNRINALGLGILQIKSFRERQAEVFKVLGVIGD
ncbi:hypothetical protein F5J12DRAFT_445782 [Pisolithus orientalis]|uniref:uncharacterized protein n=1 Tax=Pisolithus orientalis TaxID=936130 RepID=UPI002223F95D|nr:uncharacterized protein F5J12DRAFT_445782 [Pisolithus orientalis]KAI6025725.1 hypothetical protein F5J12DRAFT_445782 [Pisolithus orientalis]